MLIVHNDCSFAFGIEEVNAKLFQSQDAILILIVEDIEVSIDSFESDMATYKDLVSIRIDNPNIVLLVALANCEYDLIRNSANDGRWTIPLHEVCVCSVEFPTRKLLGDKQGLLIIDLQLIRIISIDSDNTLLKIIGCFHSNGKVYAGYMTNLLIVNRAVE